MGARTPGSNFEAAAGADPRSSAVFLGGSHGTRGVPNPPSSRAGAERRGPPPKPSAAAPPTTPQRDLRGMLGGVGAKISEVADLPTVSDINVKQVLIGGLKDKTGEKASRRSSSLAHGRRRRPWPESRRGGRPRRYSGGR